MTTPTTTEPVLEAMDKAAQKSMSQVASHDDWLRGILRAALQEAGVEVDSEGRMSADAWALKRLLEAAGIDREQAAEEGASDVED